MCDPDSMSKNDSFHISFGFYINPADELNQLASPSPLMSTLGIYCFPDEI